MKRISPNSRESDERLLRWLRLRNRWSAYQIAKADGVSRGMIIKMTNAVAIDDTRESGEATGAFYSWI